MVSALHRKAPTMFPLLRKLLQQSRKAVPLETDAEAPEVRAERIRSILRAELSQTSIDGKPITHRRLLSLMLTAGAEKKETIQRLREIGARPSARLGNKVWTLARRADA